MELPEPRLRSTGQYEEVVSVPLLAEWTERDRARTLTVRGQPQTAHDAVDRDFDRVDRIEAYRPRRQPQIVRLAAVPHLAQRSLCDRLRSS